MTDASPPSASATGGSARNAIRILIDGGPKPLAELPGSSGRLSIDTAALTDGEHRLCIETLEAARVTGRREIPFTVRNGPGIAVAGLGERDEVRGRLALVVDASAAGIDARLDVRSLELHRGLPFWMGGAALVVILLCAAYLAIDPLRYRQYAAEANAVRGAEAVPAGSAATGLPVPEPAKANPMRLNLAEGSYLPVLDFDAGKADPARGAATYAADCAGCHGNAGEGRSIESASLGKQGLYPRLAGQPAAYLYRQLWSFAHGWRLSVEMPPMADALTPADWGDVAVFLEGLSGTAYPPPPAIASDLLTLGRTIATLGRPQHGVSACVSCHGPGGIGIAPYFPALMGQSAPYLAAQIAAFRSGRRRNAMLRLMEPVAHGLEDREIAAVAAYFAQVRPGATP